MTQATYPYSFMPAGDRYQALLRQGVADDAVKAATPTGKVSVYNLKSRLPDWKYLLDVGSPSVYSAHSLRTAIAVLEDTDATMPHATKSDLAEAAMQLQRFKDTLALKL